MQNFNQTENLYKYDLVEIKIKSSTKASEQFLKFKEKLGLDLSKLVVMNKIL